MARVPVELVWNGFNPVAVLRNLPDAFPQDPFWSETIARAHGRPELLPLAQADEVYLKPAGFIFHMARCGSTLACRMLQATEQVLVLSEPLLMQTLLYGGQIAVEQRISYLRSVLGLYQKGLSQDHQGMIIKWSSACTRHIGLIQQAFPECLAYLFTANQKRC